MTKKKLLPLFIFIFIASLLSAQDSNNKYDLLLMSGTVQPAANMKAGAAMKPQANETINGKYYRIIQFLQLPSAEEKSELKSKGVELLIYLPNFAYFASIDDGTDISALNIYADIRSIIPVAPEYKIHPSLKDNNLPDFAEVVKGKADLTLIYFTGIPATSVLDELKSTIKGIKILEQDDAANRIQVRVNKELVSKLPLLSFIQYIEPVDKWVLENNSGTTEHRSNTINNFMTGGLRFDGTGVGVSIGDAGAYFGHIDFKGRYTGAVSPGADHGTHVAGILTSAGNINPRYRGHAPGATISYASGYADIISMSAIAALYNGAGKTRITTHSLGQTLNAGYTSDARQSDLEVDSLHSIFHVHSCGNSGSGWSTITGGYKVGKNAIAVGNLDYTDLIASSSSRGPSKDGRIKPDICAKGTNVQSTLPGNLYGLMTGTSMASPAIAGSIAQLIDAYRSMNNGSDPILAQLKGIMLNTAEDLGTTGPDYVYGWGRVNVWKSYKAMKDVRYFSSSIKNAELKTHTITVPPNVGELKVMVYWADPAAAAGVTKALINDLDITLSDGNTSYTPWVLNKLSPATAATKGLDRDNNMEQVSVLAPAAGSYTLNVTGYLVPQEPQEYWVTYEYLTDSIEVTYPMGGESFVPGETEYIRWDTYGTTGTFTVEYSPDNGATWNTLSSSVAGTDRYYTWIVPNTLTRKALIRVSRGGKSGQNAAGFNIMAVPAGLKVDWRCAGNFQLSWNAVAGATSYEVYLLGQKYMISQGTTSTLNFIVTAPNSAIAWTSVRALSDTGQLIGRRAVAIQVGTAVVLCDPTSVNETNPDSPYGISVYPNPVSDQAVVVIHTKEKETVSIKVFDISGKEVFTLLDNKTLLAGDHRFTLDEILADGIYFVVVNGSNRTACGKIVVARN